MITESDLIPGRTLFLLRYGLMVEVNVLGVTKHHHKFNLDFQYNHNGKFKGSYSHSLEDLGIPGHAKPGTKQRIFTNRADALAALPEHIATMDHQNA